MKAIQSRLGSLLHHFRDCLEHLGATPPAKEMTERTQLGPCLHRGRNRIQPYGASARNSRATRSVATHAPGLQQTFLYGEERVSNERCTTRPPRELESALEERLWIYAIRPLSEPARFRRPRPQGGLRTKKTVESGSSQGPGLTTAAGNRNQNRRCDFSYFAIFARRYRQWPEATKLKWLSPATMT